MKLKKYKLGDIAKIEISGVDKKTIEGETPVRLCNFVDVYYNWAITKEKAKSFMVASAKQTEIDKCSIGKGMVAITKDSETRDDIGVATYIADDFEYVLLGYHCALITPNPAIVDGKYLNAFMHTRYIQKYFENNASGSGQRYTLSNDTISNIPVLLPSIEEQHTIGKLLADLDRKIELNKQINDNLEAIAKQLYDYWFVQFDFPNEEGKPYKSSGGAMVWSEKLKREIPQGWIASDHSDLFTIGNGQTIPQNEGLIPAYGGNGIVKMVEISNYPACIIIGRVGANCGSIHYSKVPCWVSDNAISVCSKNDDWRPFLFYSLSLYNLSKNKGGSSQPLITHEALKHLYFPMSEKHINQFCHIVNELQDLIYSNQQEILKLTKQRDELLPLLMNGQATVNYHLTVLFITKIMLYYKETNINFRYERNNNTKRFRWNESGSVS